MTTSYATIPLRNHNHSGVSVGGQLDHGTAHTAASLTGGDDHTQYLENVVEDLTPQLGGDLDAQDNDILQVGAAGHDLSSTGVLIRADGSELTARSLTVGGLSWVGRTNPEIFGNNNTLTMVAADGILFILEDVTTGGAGCFFATFDSATITVISDILSLFDITDVDNAKWAVFTSVNSNTISIKNYKNATHSLRFLSLGHLNSATAPV